MEVDDLIMMYEYDRWANDRVLSAVGKLSWEEITASDSSGHGSIRNTLVHTVSAQWGWVGKCGGPPRGSRLNPEDFLSFDEIADKFEIIGRDTREFLATLTGRDLARMVSYENGSGAMVEMSMKELLHHAATHSVHHRGQVCAMIRAAGREPEDLDLLLFHGERRGVQAW